MKAELAESPLDAVRTSRWAYGLGAGQLQRVLSAVTEREVPAGSHVCRKMVTYTGVTAGGWFSEGSLLKNELRRYEIVALRDTHIASMPRGRRRS